MDKTAIRKVNKNSAGNDFEFWQTQSYEKRLEALEQIRQEYNSWKYDNYQRFHRVFSIVKK